MSHSTSSHTTPGDAAGARATAERAVFDPALKRLAAVVVLGSIMSILDTTIVAVALDTLGRAFKVQISTIQWVTTGYLLALAVVIPVTGWAMDRVGARRMWMLSLSLFITGSALCGLAWSANSLIIFRVLQGLGGGMILPIGQAMLARAAGPKRLGRVMSVVGVPTVMGPVLGPVLGGLIVSHASWRWIFFVNVPVGILALMLSWRWLAASQPRAENRFDLRGFLLLSPGLALLVYGLSRVGVNGGFSSLGTILSFAVGALLIVGFAWHGLHSRDPASALIDLHLFRHRTYSIANLTGMLLGALLYGSMFLLPLYYQVVRGQSALIAGLLMAPQGLGAAMVMRKGGALTDRLGAGAIVPFGIGFIILSSLPFAFVTSTTSEPLLAAALLVRGVGLGLTLMPVMATAYAELDPSAVPRATSTVSISRQIGGSVATALFAVVLQRHITAKLPHAASHGLSLTTGARVPPHVTSSLASAFAATFWWVVAIGAILLIPSLLLPRRRQPPRHAGHSVRAVEPARESG